MGADLETAGDVVETYERVVARLLRSAPKRAQRLFLNAELRDSSDGMTISADVFYVVKPFLRKPERHQHLLDADCLNLLTQIGRHLMQKANQTSLIIDVIANVDGKYKSVIDYGQLRRLAGDHMFRERHKRYAANDPLLAGLD